MKIKTIDEIIGMLDPFREEIFSELENCSNGYLDHNAEYSIRLLGPEKWFKATINVNGESFVEDKTKDSKTKIRVRGKRIISAKVGPISLLDALIDYISESYDNVKANLDAATTEEEKRNVWGGYMVQHTPKQRFLKECREYLARTINMRETTFLLDFDKKEVIHFISKYGAEHQWYCVHDAGSMMNHQFTSSDVPDFKDGLLLHFHPGWSLKCKEKYKKYTNPSFSDLRFARKHKSDLVIFTKIEDPSCTDELTNEPHHNFFYQGDKNFCHLNRHFLLTHHNLLPYSRKVVRKGMYIGSYIQLMPRNENQARRILESIC